MLDTTAEKKEFLTTPVGIVTRKCVTKMAKTKTIKQLDASAASPTAILTECITVTECCAVWQALQAAIYQIYDKCYEMLADDNGTVTIVNVNNKKDILLRAAKEGD